MDEYVYTNSGLVRPIDFREKSNTLDKEQRCIENYTSIFGKQLRINETL